jgi:anti-anti-sigma factor
LKTFESESAVVISEAFPVRSLDDQQKFLKEIDALIEHGKVNLVFNVDKVAYLMTIELGSLVAAVKKARTRGGKVKLVAVGEFLDNLLNLTNLKGIFEISPKLGEILLMEKVITEEQLEKALEYRRKYPGMKLGQALIDLNFATDETVTDALRRQQQVT